MSFGVPQNVPGGEPSSLPDRLSVSLTVVLALSAYKIVVTQNLPTLAYLTQLDYFCLVSEFVCSFIVFTHGISNAFDFTRDQEYICYGILTSLYGVFVFVYSVRSLIRFNKHVEKIQKAGTADFEDAETAKLRKMGQSKKFTVSGSKKEMAPLEQV